jgi:hypothetical protein
VVRKAVNCSSDISPEAMANSRCLSQVNLCVWNKDNGGMGGLYRSKHELVFVLRKPGATSLNNVQLGRHGWNRTNVWDYPGVNTLGRGRMDELAMHPTVKPVALVADAIRDCTNRGDLVLDAFAGSGTTLIAAERIGRVARCLEIDPVYVDVAIRRWQKLTGQPAIEAVSGRSFAEIARERETYSAEPAAASPSTSAPLLADRRAGASTSCGEGGVP